MTQAWLSLALLVTCFLTDYANHAVTFDYFAITANFFNRCSYFHLNTPALARHTCATNDARFFQNTVILSRHQVRLDLVYKVHQYDNDDQ